MEENIAGGKGCLGLSLSFFQVHFSFFSVYDPLGWGSLKTWHPSNAYHGIGEGHLGYSVLS